MIHLSVIVIDSLQLFPVEAVIERYELILPHSDVISMLLKVFMSEPWEVRLVLGQSEGSQLQVAQSLVVLQHLHTTYTKERLTEYYLPFGYWDEHPRHT